MTDISTARTPWYRPMSPRGRDEPHRASTPLELLFDLCFVVAIAKVGFQVEQQFAHGHTAAGIIGYGTVFFAIWWAWMNFTWFASAYDNDDVPYRLSVLVQIAGSLVLAAGVAPVFDPDHSDFSVLVIGYVIMRLATVSNWLRAGNSDPDRRRTAHRYALGVVGVQALWISRLALPEGVQLPSFLLLVALELAVPALAERTGITPYHPSHIAERYGLFTVIVLGESVTAVVRTLEAAVHEAEHKAGLIGLAAAGLLILFAMWWVYFDRSAVGMLETLNSSLLWGYGHYLIFSSIAAVGAGINVRVEYDVGEAHIPPIGAALAVSVPVAVFLVVVWALHLRHQHTPIASASFPVAAVLVLGAAVTGAPVQITAIIMVTLVVVTVATSRAGSASVTPVGTP